MPINADEIFTSGNAQKIMHATKFEDRHLQWGPLSRRARELYWDADVESIVDDAKNRIRDNGRGAYGIVDEKLPKDISELTDADR